MSGWGWRAEGLGRPAPHHAILNTSTCVSKCSGSTRNSLVRALIQRDVLQGASRSLIPLAFFHVDAAVFSEGDAFLSQERSLVGEVGREPSRVVDDAVARIIAVAIRLTQHGSDQARVFLSADEARYLTVRGDASRRDFCHDGENLINQIFVQDFSHRIAPVFAFAFKVAGLIADPGSAASPEKHRGKARACQGRLTRWRLECLQQD